MIKIKNAKKIAIASTVIYMLLGVGIYFLIPYLLNYPPNSINNDFQVRVAGLTYTKQFTIIGIFLMLVNYISVFILFRKIDNWENIKISKDSKTVKEIINIRNTCFNGIYKLMPIQLIIVTTLIIVLLTLSSTEIGLTLKLTAIICSWIIVVNLILSGYTNKLFNNILEKTYSYVQKTETNIKKFSIRKKILFQSTSVMLVIVFILSLFAYSRILIERSDFLKEKEITQLNNVVKNNSNDLLEYIKNSEEKYFLLDKDFNVSYSNIKMTEFSREYIKEYTDINRTYSQYGSTLEGVYLKTEINGNIFYIGKMYDVMPLKYAVIIVSFDIVLMLLYVVIINFFAKGIKDELINCADNLYEIGNNTKAIGGELAVTSNDEFRDLIQAYNKVQQTTKYHIKELGVKQDIIVKQQQLVILGELAGGVAHDINTPISAIKSGLLMLKDTAKNDDEKMLMNRMDSCADKIITLVNSLRNQIRNIGSDEKISVNIASVIKDTSIIANNELVRSGVKLNMNIRDDLTIIGEPTKLGQVITNIIMNAVQAYEGKPGVIDVDLYKSSKNEAVITVEDYAGGIPESVKPYIFKNILTTKGVSGTGFGLYLAYSVIKGAFGGEITFISSEGKGTRFYIIIPLDGNE